MQILVRPVRITYHTLLYTMTGLFILGSCSSKNKTPENAEQHFSNISQPIHDTYQLTAAQFKTANMQLVKLKMHIFNKTIKVNGIIEPPPQNKISVNTYFGGYIKTIHVLPGQNVSSGQPLFSLEHPNYIQTQQDFLETKSQLAYLKSDFERQKKLLQNKVTSQKNYLKAEMKYAMARIQYESIKKKIVLMRINPNQLNEKNIYTKISIIAPVTGYISDININQGLYLAPTQTALSIINTEHLHIELAGFEQDLAVIKIGQPIKFKIQGSPDKEYKARVYLINRSIDPKTRTASIHGHLEDEKLAKQLNPGAYLEAEIYVSSSKIPAIAQEAVAKIGEHHYVLIKEKNKSDTLTFIKKEVKIGQTDENYMEVLNHHKFSQDEEFLSKGILSLMNK